MGQVEKHRTTAHSSADTNGNSTSRQPTNRIARTIQPRLRSTRFASVLIGACSAASADQGASHVSCSSWLLRFCPANLYGSAVGLEQSRWHGHFHVFGPLADCVHARSPQLADRLGVA